MAIHHLPPIDRQNPFNSLGKPPKGALGKLHTSKPIFYVKHTLEGDNKYIYHVGLIDILDRVFRFQGLKFSSKQQERFLERFFEACQTIHENDAEDRYNNVEDAFRDLDNFLGNYLGVDDGQYVR